MERLFKRVLKAGVSALLCVGCSGGGDQPDPRPESEARFTQGNLELSSAAGVVTVTVGWTATSWEVIMDEDLGMISEIAPSHGGDAVAENQFTRIKISYGENTGLKSRIQELFLVNGTTGERSRLTIEQSSRFQTVSMTLDPSVRYQPVVGFGGMYNPVIWLGSNLISAADITKMYSSEGLGYNILRLMIYPRESDWAADVEGALLAQQHGAIIFASPWDCTDALADQVNGKKHLKPENYSKYADHLVKYIDYMKAQGVNLYAISVQNEPDMDFTWWSPAEVVAFVRDYGDRIRNTGVKLMSPEACGTSPEYTDPILNDVAAFERTDILAGHLYQGFIDWSTSYPKNRHDYIVGLYNSHLAPAGKTWWMTEHLFNDGERESDPALWQFRKWSYEMEHLGKELHMSMEGYCSAYVYWYLKRFYGMIADNDHRSQTDPGNVLGNGYILSHYAKYASGMTRIEIENGDPNLLATAYVDESGDEMTVVLLNMRASSVQALITSPSAVKSVSAVESTETHKMRSVAANVTEDEIKNVSVLLSANSIASVRLKL
jgi:glucuronoarabinoxylan endo-1,4-beta-xylanase